MILVIAATECMIYMVMAVCVIRLRKLQPDAERSFKIKGGNLIPVIVIVIYGIVGGFILFGPVKPQDVTDQRIAKSFIAGLIALNCIYVFGIWPRLRAKYQKIAEARKPRRRRRRPPANEPA
jgi:amino acid transporter